MKQFRKLPWTVDWKKTQFKAATCLGCIAEVRLFNPHERIGLLKQPVVSSLDIKKSKGIDYIQIIIK